MHFGKVYLAKRSLEPELQAMISADCLSAWQFRLRG